ncbi:MAG: glycosyltransferase family 2 protein [Ferruginibacter sp.]
MPLISVFTPTYNRAGKLHRVFDSLTKQTFKNFEWVIVDDGSKDDTKQLIDKFIEQQPFFSIQYSYQENSGKAIAINSGVKMALGEWFYIADSDDALIPQALEILMDAWKVIPESEKNSYSGIVACCKDQFGKRISNEVPGGVYNGNWRDLFYKQRFRREATNINKLKCLKEFPFPDQFKGIYIAEAITWRRMSDKYKIRLISDEVRIYFMENSTDSIIYRHKKYIHKALSSCVEIKDALDKDLSYFFYFPSYFMKMALLYHAYRPFLKGWSRSVVKLNKNAGIFAAIFMIPGLLLHLIFLVKGK